MKRTSIITLTLIMLFTYSSSVYANQNDDTLKLLEVTGSIGLGAQMGNAMAQHMISSLKATRPDIDPKVFTIIEEETLYLINSEMKKSDGLANQLVKIYSKYYNHQDIKDLLEFYQSELGKKLITTMPNIMAESMIAGQKWGTSFSPLLQERIQNRFKEEGIKLQ